MRSEGYVIVAWRHHSRGRDLFRANAPGNRPPRPSEPAEFGSMSTLPQRSKARQAHRIGKGPDHLSGSPEGQEGVNPGG
jgi:hypothetical protein